jgi:putative ABC transport system permease protein
MGIPLVSGRVFGDQDGTKGPPTIVIDQAFARKYFAHDNPVGQHIRVELGDDVFDHPMREIVGVVGDVRSRGLTTEAAPHYYVPYAQAVITNPYLTIRSKNDAASIEGEVRAAVREMDKSVPVYQVSTLDDYVSKSAAQPRFQTFLLTCFAGIAVALAAIGLYGLLSYMVVQRTLEIGLRMALGAQRADVLAMIVRRGLTLALIGVGVGLTISIAVTKLLAGMLYGIRPYDLATFAATSILLLVVSVVASSIPAYRAAQLNPIATLREQ